MMQSEQINELAAALSKAQGAMENAPMNKINPHFKSKYADLASVLNAARAPLSTNGLAITQAMEIREGGLVMRTTLMHTSGQWMASEYPLPATARPQEMGSAQTYARRYSLAALICNSADEDDDAEGAETGKQKTETKGRTPPKPAPNVMTKPPYDPETGELPAGDAAAPAAPEPAGAAGTISSTVEDADKQLADAAKLGSANLEKKWWELSKEQRDILRAALNRRHKKTAKDADEAIARDVH